MSLVQQNPVTAMLSLAQDLRQQSYVPARPILVPLHKGDGSFRSIAVFPIRDRVVQRAILQVVQAVTARLFMPSSFGFRPGLGVKHAMACARRWVDAGFQFAVAADIRQCFDSIPHTLLMQKVASLLAEQSVCQLLSRCVDVSGNAVRATGIAQGSCLSPWLCNLYLHDFDCVMHTHCTPLVRFADDFVLLVRSYDSAQLALERAAAWMTRHGLTLHANKTRILAPFQTTQFLGRQLARPPLLLANR